MVQTCTERGGVVRSGLMRRRELFRAVPAASRGLASAWAWASQDARDARQIEETIALNASQQVVF